MTDTIRDYASVINGADVISNAWIEVLNPASGVPFARIPAGSADDIDAAVKAARAAAPAWAATPPAVRGRLLRNIARIILERREELADVRARFFQSLVVGFGCT